jgi:hypothetical protein
MKYAAIFAWASALVCACSAGPRQLPIGGNDVGGSGSGSGSGGGSGSGSGGTADAGRDAETDASTDGPTGTGFGFNIYGGVTEFLKPDTLSGAMVCSRLTPKLCDQSATSGVFSLKGLGGAGDGLTVTLTGYTTGVFPLSMTYDLTSFDAALRTTATMSNLAQQANATFDQSTGAIFFQADAGGGVAAGATVTTNPPGKVVYTDQGATPNPGNTSITQDGRGYVFQLPPGNVDVTFALGQAKCAPTFSEGWPGQNGASTSVPVVAGALTTIRVNCQ